MRSSGEFVEQFLQEFQAIVPADYICWHEFTADFSMLLQIRGSTAYEDELNSRMEAFSATVSLHPILSRIGFKGVAEHPCRLSDFASNSTFRSNPLYHEVYRHLAARYQLMFHVATVGEVAIGFTVNRWLKDFTEAERQKLHCLCLGLGRLLTLQHDQELAIVRLRTLTLALEQHTGLVGLDTLTTREVTALGAVYKSQTQAEAAVHTHVSLETFKGHMSSAREKLNLETTNQLRAALRSLTQS